MSLSSRLSVLYEGASLSNCRQLSPGFECFVLVCACRARPLRRRGARRRTRPPQEGGPRKLLGYRRPLRLDRSRCCGLAGRGPEGGGLGRQGIEGARTQRAARRRDDPGIYGRAYGFERAMDNLGAIGGPLLALGLVAAIGVRGAILVSVVPGILAAVAILYAIRHAPRLDGRGHRPVRIRVRPVIRGTAGKAHAGRGAFEAGNVAATLLILRATELLEPGRGQGAATQIALGFYIAYYVAATLTSLGAGRVSDSLGNVPVLAAGAAAFLLAYLGFAVGSVPLASAASVVAGVGIGCVETAEQAAVASLAPEHYRGSAFGLLAAIQSFGNLAASGVAGLLWTVFSPSAAFAYLAARMVVALAGFSSFLNLRALAPT